MYIYPSVMFILIHVAIFIRLKKFISIPSLFLFYIYISLQNCSIISQLDYWHWCVWHRSYLYFLIFTCSHFCLCINKFCTVLSPVVSCPCARFKRKNQKKIWFCGKRSWSWGERAFKKKEMVSSGYQSKVKLVLKRFLIALVKHFSEVVE